jgi:hypothetical protein
MIAQPFVSSYTPIGRGETSSPTFHFARAIAQPSASIASSSGRLDARNGSASSTRPRGARLASKMRRSGACIRSAWRMTAPMVKS